MKLCFKITLPFLLKSQLEITIVAVVLLYSHKKITYVKKTFFMKCLNTKLQLFLYEENDTA